MNTYILLIAMKLARFTAMMAKEGKIVIDMPLRLWIEKDKALRFGG